MRTRLASSVTIALILAGLGLAGCAKGGSSTPGAADSPSPSAVPSTAADPAERAREIVAKLSDEDLVGQVLVPYAYGNSATDVSAGSVAGNKKISGVATPAEIVAKYRLGGLILVSSSADDPTGDTNPTTNVESPQQVRALTDGLQAAAAKLPAGVPMLIGTDQEFGTVTRIRTGVTELPSAMAFGAAGDPKVTEAAWKAAGTELAAMGLNVDFAPDADVLGPAGSGVIGSRSFGSDPAKVSAQVAAAVRGLQSAGVAATLKHFPGHGHTTADSHSALPTLSQNRAALDSGDLPPFTAGIQAGTGLIMSGHLNVTSIDPGVPASFSHKVLTDLLRTQLHFDGVVVTDALNMEPAMQWPAGEAAVRALVAGNDLLLMPPDLPAAQAGLLAGLKSGALPRARLVEAVQRILTLKLRGAANQQPALSTVASSEHAAAAAAVNSAAVTVLRGTCTGPLVHGPVRVTTAGGRDKQRQWLTEALKAEGVQVVSSGGSVVHLVGYGDGAADLAKGAAVTVAMDTPYLLRQVPSGTLVATYSSTQASIRALAKVIAGKAPAPGRSPVVVSGLPASACSR